MNIGYYIETTHRRRECMINKVIKGDLIKMAKEGKFDIIVHGCNCFCCMGGGIAKQIRETFPLAYTVDCNTEKGSESKLGDYSVAKRHFQDYNGNLTIINAYTQYTHWEPFPVEYGAIKKVFQKLNRVYGSFDVKIGIPKIGAGLAGGDWDTIETIINATTPNLDITLVEFVK